MTRLRVRFLIMGRLLRYNWTSKLETPWSRQVQGRKCINVCYVSFTLCRILKQFVHARTSDLSAEMLVAWYSEWYSFHFTVSDQWIQPIGAIFFYLFIFFTAANLTSAHVELITWIICPSKPTVSCMHKIWDWLNLNGMKPLLMLLITPVLPMACQNDCHEGGLLPKLSAFTGNMHSDVIQS